MSVAWMIVGSLAVMNVFLFIVAYNLSCVKVKDANGLEVSKYCYLLSLNRMFYEVKHLLCQEMMLPSVNLLSYVRSGMSGGESNWYDNGYNSVLYQTPLQWKVIVKNEEESICFKIPQKSVKTDICDIVLAWLFLSVVFFGPIVSLAWGQGAVISILTSLMLCSAFICVWDYIYTPLKYNRRLKRIETKWDISWTCQLNRLTEISEPTITGIIHKFTLKSKESLDSPTASC